MTLLRSILIIGTFSGIAIAALSVAAREVERGRLERDALTRLAASQWLDPTTTGAISRQDENGAPFHARFELLDRHRLGELAEAPSL